MSLTTSNMTPTIRSQVYSQFLVDMIQAGMLPDGIARDVSDFGDGTTLNIPVLGDVVISDLIENSPVPYNPVSTGQVTMTITEYVGSGYYVTDKLKQDAYIIDQILGAMPNKMLRKIREKFETDMLAQVNVGQTLSDPNVYNGTDHRYVAGGTTNRLTLDDIAYMKLVFDKAYVPDEGRILIVGAYAEAQLNKAIAGQAFINNPQFEGIVTTGFARHRRFVRNIFGFDIWTSDRLPRVAVAETINATNRGTNATAAVGSEVAIAMSIADDQTKPFMTAWRQMPKVEGERNKDLLRDEYVVSARYGDGVQRIDTLGAILVASIF